MVAIAIKINTYTCRKCLHQIVTVLADEGVTPFMIGCDSCKDGEAYSGMFSCSQNLKPKYEWFKPSTDDEIVKQIEWEMTTFHGQSIRDELAKIGVTIENLLRETKQHVAKGGLLLRAVRQ